MAHFGLTKAIDAHYLSGLVNLSPNRPVFLLTATDGSHVVIKQEVQVHAGDAQNMKFALKAVKTVSPAAAGKSLTQGEIQVLQDHVDIHEYIANATMRALDPDTAYLKQLLINGGLWFKMDKAEGITNIEAAKVKAAAGDKSGVRAIAAALSAPDGLEALGRIIAADLWSGNNDRFAPSGSDKPGYRVCQNPENVLLSIQGTLKPIGLDAYEAMGAYRNYNSNIEDIEGIDTWGGRLLAHTERAALKDFCRKAVADIEDTLGPRNRRGLGVLGRKSRLPADAATRLQHGIISGALPIRAKMRQLAGKPGAPAGLINRLTILGWWP